MKEGPSVTSRSDDPSIPNKEELYRFICKEWILPAQATGHMYLSSAAFSDRQDEISVDLSSLSMPEWSFQRGQQATRGSVAGVVGVTAGQARGLTQKVVRDPLPENLAHALVCGRQTKAVKRQLARMARWIFPEGARPPGIP